MMKQSFLHIILIIVTVCVFITPSYSFAADNNPAADSQVWIPLDAVQTIQDGRTFTKLIAGSVTHKPGSVVYIVECLDSTTDRVCSTGTPEGDYIIYQSDENLKRMQNLYSYSFTNIYSPDGLKPLQNPTSANQFGKIPDLAWESSSQGDVARKFYGVDLIQETQDTGAGVVSSISNEFTGNVGGMQQGALGFPTLTPTPTPTPIPPPVYIPDTTCASCVAIEWHQPTDEELHGSEGGCAVLHGTWEQGDNGKWGCNDPYGRVFDSLSLEPIPNAKVTLLVKRKNGTFTFMSPKETTNAIINPWTTREDGKYVFLVPPGTYQLQVELPGYSFPFTSQSLDKNYNKAYYELYYAPSYEDKNIVEVKVEHRDIPVVPKAEPYQSQVKLLGYLSELDKQNQQYHITGRTSHPLTIVDILGIDIRTKKITRSLKSISSDKWGFFNTTINTSFLWLNETVGMAKMTKVNLSDNSEENKTNTSLPHFFFNQIHSLIPGLITYAVKPNQKIQQVTYASINPILNYIEGYAYTNDNTAITDGTVQIYLQGSKKPFYTTHTSSTGYFNIPSDHLPQMNYFISYKTKNNNSYQITQSEFLAQNSQGIITNKIDLNKYQTQSLNEEFAKRSKQPAPNLLSNKKNNDKLTPLTAAKTSSNYFGVFLTIIFLLVFFIAITAFFLYRKRKIY